MPKAEDYRKRACVFDKKSRALQPIVERMRLIKKVKALNDMAANEDWLEGNPASSGQ